MAVDGVSGTAKTGTDYGDMVFSDKKDNSVQVQDFLNLMIMQMKNQDFTNPMDDSQMLTQMAQFATMQQMQELAEYSKSNYVASLLGKTVTAARFTVSGDLDSETGPIQKISLLDNDYTIFVNDKSYSLEQIMEIHSSDGGNLAFNGANTPVEAGTIADNWAEIKWSSPTTDEDLEDTLTYKVYYSKSPIRTLEEIDKDGTLAHTANHNTYSWIVTGLESDTQYYMNIVAEDKNGNRSALKGTTLHTEKGSGTGETPDPPETDPPETDPPETET